MKCIIEVRDEVNVKFCNVDVSTRRKMKKQMEYLLPHARHTPAYKMGRWDGKVSFCNLAGVTQLNLIDRVLPIVIEDGYEVEIQDNRVPFEWNPEPISEDYWKNLDIKWPEGHQFFGEYVTLRDYQVEAINAFLKNHQGIQKLSTGAGKTILTATLTKLVEEYTGGGVLTIVPSVSLVEQTSKDYINVGLDTGVYYGNEKDVDHKHIITTWQSLEVLNKETKKGKTNDDGETPMEVFLDGIIGVIVDECHTVKGNVLRENLTGPLAHLPIRWGVTGTIPKPDWELLPLIGSIGEIIGDGVTASSLQEKGVLSNCHINVQQLKENRIFNGFQDEKTYLTTNPERINYIGSRLAEIVTSGNTLILVDKIKTGELLRDYINENTDVNARFVFGGTKKEERSKHYQDMRDGENELIVATYGVASVGIDIPRIFNLVLIEPGKSFIRVIQSIGRGIRKAKDKDFVNIYDFCANTKYSKAHLRERKKFYAEANYPYTISKIDWDS